MVAAVGTKTRETQVVRSARTRTALLSAARQLFAEKGFAETGRDEIAERAGVTRGALYHHFTSKTAVAAGVVDQLEEELVARVVVAAREGSGVRDQLRRGCLAYMEACADPSVARILADAPAVLGVAACRDLDASSCVPLLEEVLRLAEAEGIDVPGDPSITASLMLGLLNEAALLIAASPEDGALQRRVSFSVEAFLDKLFA